jgi:hypothetical protein
MSRTWQFWLCKQISGRSTRSRTRRPTVRRPALAVERLEDRTVLAALTVNSTAHTTTPGAMPTLRATVEIVNGKLASNDTIQFSLPAGQQVVTIAVAQVGGGQDQLALDQAVWTAEGQAGTDQEQFSLDVEQAANGLSQGRRSLLAKAKSDALKLASDLNILKGDVATASGDAPDPAMTADVMKFLQAAFGAARNFLTGQVKAFRRQVQKAESALNDYWNRINSRINDLLNMANGLLD